MCTGLFVMLNNKTLVQNDDPNGSGASWESGVFKPLPFKATRILEITWKQPAQFRFVSKVIGTPDLQFPVDK